MKNLRKYLMLSALSLAIVACSKDKDTVSNNVKLQFKNTFADTEIVLGAANTATTHTSEAGQAHAFSELKYVISNISLIKEDGSEFPYHVNDLDKGATVINQANTASLSFVLNNIPAGEYKQIKFGLGVKNALNTVDEVRFPNFYANAGRNNTAMMWEWGTGYRFTKIEGFYDVDNKELSIHTGSTVDGTNGDESTYVQGVDAFRNIVLDLTTNAIVGETAPTIHIKADFDYLLSGNDIITLSSGTEMNNNATPSLHTAVQMTRFVNNIGGDGSTDTKGMFSIISVEN